MLWNHIKISPVCVYQKMVIWGEEEEEDYNDDDNADDQITFYPYRTQDN